MTVKKKMENPPQRSKKVSVISDAQIRERAQQIYEIRKRKGINGSANSDWLQAKQELTTVFSN